MTITERGMGQAVKEYAVGEGMLAETDALKVDPSAVKQLGPGECVVITQGRAQHVAVSQVRIQERTPTLSPPMLSIIIAEIDPNTRQTQCERVVQPDGNPSTSASAEQVEPGSHTTAPQASMAAPTDEVIREY